MLRLLFLSMTLFLGFSQHAKAQAFESVYPGLSGDELLDSLFDRYLPITVLPYTQARDTLYAKVLAVDDDTLRCIYSGHALYLDPGADPTQYVYQNGSPNGMNTEHAYPQSKGAADGNARSNMHHLYPVRIAVNEARGDVPFGEIPDAQTQKWFYKDQTLSSVPVVNKDLYTESKTGLFEPRESVKGDIARAVFYFYTIYRNQANAADPNYFSLQRATLCQWHAQDPADMEELKKTWRIAHWQENKPNPYILDCSLAFRAFCQDITNNCVSDVPYLNQPSISLRIVPQPVSAGSVAEMELPFGGDISGCIMLPTGQVLVTFEQKEVSAGRFQWPISVEGPQGYYILEIQLTGRNGERLRKSAPLVK